MRVLGLGCNPQLELADPPRHPSCPSLTPQVLLRPSAAHAERCGPHAGQPAESRAIGAAGQHQAGGRCGGGGRVTCGGCSVECLCSFERTFVPSSYHGWCILKKMAACNGCDASQGSLQLAVMRRWGVGRRRRGAMHDPTLAPLRSRSTHSLPRPRAPRGSLLLDGLELVWPGRLETPDRAPQRDRRRSRQALQPRACRPAPTHCRRRCSPPPPTASPLLQLLTSTPQPHHHPAPPTTPTRTAPLHPSAPLRRRQPSEQRSG